MAPTASSPTATQPIKKGMESTSNGSCCSSVVVVVVAGVGGGVGAGVGTGVGAGVGGCANGRAHSAAILPPDIRQQHQRVKSDEGSAEHVEAEPSQQHSPPDAVYGK